MSGNQPQEQRNQQQSISFTSQIPDQHPNRMKFQEALSHVGGSDRYQWLLAFNLDIQWIFMSMMTMFYSFWLSPPNFICEDGEICNQTKATEQNRCGEQYLAPTGDYTSITVDLNLYCENSYKLVWSQSIVYIGAAFGSFLITQLSDYVGRKYPVQILSLISGLLVFFMAITHDYTFFMFLQFLVGFITWPLQCIEYVILQESINGKLRQRSLVACMMFWAIGEIILSGIGYWIPNWRDAMMYGIALPYLLFNIPNYFFVFESPMYYLSKNTEKCIQTLNKIAKFNGKQQLPEQITEIIPDDLKNTEKDEKQQSMISLQEQQEQNEEENQINQQLLGQQDPSQNSSYDHKTQKGEENISDDAIIVAENQKKKYYVYHLFTYKSLLTLVFGCSMISAGSNIIYFGSSLFLAEIKMNVYLSLLIVGCSELFANLVVGYFIYLIPRKKGIIFFELIIMLFSFGFLLFPEKSGNLSVSNGAAIFQIVFTSIIRVFNVFVGSLHSLIQQESFPTPIRSQATGVNNTFSTLFSFVTPFIVNFANAMHIYPIIIVSLIGGLFIAPVLLLKETLGQPIKQCVDEDRKKN